ncbi:MAG: hypothetical protein ACFFBP_11635 [Promethearchaeota archaeon]
MYSDIFFYLDLTKDYLKGKDIIKSIKEYIVEKNKINIKGHYGILIFQEEGNPIFITDKKDSEIISKAIEENWKNRAKKTSYFENGLFYIFSYIAETVRKKSKLNRIIVITDTPSDLSGEYQEALFNLVSKIKHFPTYIDIIRIMQEDTRLQKDDVKLNILASDTKGGIFYVNNKKEFNTILKKLVKTKQPVSTFQDKLDEIKIKTEDYDFYNHLAKKLQSPINKENLKCYFCKDEICPVCTNINDIPLTCEDCNVGFHTCCAINHTLTHNIGIPHIFRCPSCDVLLQIDQNLIIGTDEPEEISIEAYLKREKSQRIIKSEQIDVSKPKMINSLGSKLIDYSPPEYNIEQKEEYEKVIRVGGFFGKIYNVKKDGGKLVYTRVDKPLKKKAIKILFCPQCGTPINSKESNICKECGNIIR